MKRLLKVLAVLLAVRLLLLSCAGDSVDANRSRLHYVSNQLLESHGSWGPSDFYAGEWNLVSMSMAALSAGNLAFTRPELLSEHRALVEKLATLALKPETRAFDTHHYGTDAFETLDTDEGHVGYLGHLMLVLGTECLLGSTAHERERTEVSNALRRRYAAAKDGLVETYQNRFWIPDNAAALAGLELDARCTGSASMAWVTRKWPRHRSGLFLFSPGVAPRGSGAGWNSIYLPYLDEALAAEQWAKAKVRFGDARLPLFRGFDEHPGAQGEGDVDSGPLVFGVSPSGSGFAVAGATFAGDTEFRAGLLALAEAVGVTVPFGGRHFLLGPLVGDASVLAGRTITRWDCRFVAKSPPACGASL